MKHLQTPLLASAVVLSIAQAVYGGDYSPTSPVPPSAGWLNDSLRAKDPYANAWDVGVQTRLRYEVRDNFGIVGSPGSMDFRDHGADVDNAYLLYRIRPRVGYTAEWFSAFVEGRHSGSTGDDRNPNLESDSMDLHQAYVTLGNHKEFPLSVKVGRQELSYGDERLIGAFAWNNIGRVFDAAKLRWQNSWFGADFFSARVVIPDDNNFNVSNDYDWFSGVYASTKKIPKQTTDFYFLSRNANAQARFAQNGSLIPLPSARDIYTIGARIKSNPGDWGNWDYSGEFMGQFGHFNDPLVNAPIGKSLQQEAFAIFAGGGYTWTQSSYTPRLGLEYNFASGDSNPTDGKHETFENLFPTNHKFYGYMDLASLQNIHDIRLTTSIKPLPHLTLLAEGHTFWLADTHDSFYAVTGARRGGIAATGGKGYGINPNQSSYVGSELDLIGTYAVSPIATLEAGYGHFFVGNYVKESLSAPAFGSTDANWVYVQLNVSF